MLEELFSESLDEFFNRETENIINNISERNLCSRLAMYLEANAVKYRLNNYYADTEYNRNQNGRVKTILDNNMQEVTINCDLILHSRGKIIARDNLIAIEMKKSERSEKEKEIDRLRLRALTKDSYDGIWIPDGQKLPKHVCGYEIGYFIEINRDKRKYIIQTFRKGELVEEREREF
jgi:hypothetical protein